MGESFAGIAVPEGDPGGLRDYARRMGVAATALHESAREVEGMPSMLGSWQGPASVNYAASCLSQSAVLNRLADGRTRAAVAVNRFADDLEQARTDARAAIAAARDADRAIKHARKQLVAARGRFDDADGRARGARTQLGVAGAGGVPRPDVQDALYKAEGEADTAERELGVWRDRLERAKDDLEGAQRSGTKAERDAKQAARATTTVIADIDDQAPQWVLPAALKPMPGSAPDKPWYEQAGDWFGDQAAQVPTGVENGINGIGAMLAHGYSGSPFARTFDPDSYDPMADPSVNPYTDPMVQAADDPVGYAKGLANWDDFSHGRVGEGLGELLPGALLGGAGGTALRTARRAAPDAPSAPAPPTGAKRGGDAAGAVGRGTAPDRFPPGTVIRRPDGSVMSRAGDDGQLRRTDADGNIIPPPRDEARDITYQGERLRRVDDLMRREQSTEPARSQRPVPVTKPEKAVELGRLLLDVTTELKNLKDLGQ